MRRAFVHRFQNQNSIESAVAGSGAAWRVQLEVQTLDFEIVALPCHGTEGFSRRM